MCGTPEKYSPCTQVAAVDLQRGNGTPPAICSWVLTLRLQFRHSRTRTTLCFCLRV